MTIGKEQIFGYCAFDVTSYHGDGLVGLWDCQNNVGFGQYDPSFNGVTNLVTGVKLQYPNIIIGYPYSHGNSFGQCNESNVKSAILGDFTYELCLGFEDGISSGEFVRLCDQTLNPIFKCASTSAAFTLEFGGLGQYVTYQVKPFTNYLLQVRCCAESNDIFVNGQIVCHADKLPQRTSLTACFPFGYQSIPPENRRLISCRVYERPLTDDEIWTNFNVDKKRFEV